MLNCVMQFSAQILKQENQKNKNDLYKKIKLKIINEIKSQTMKDC